MPTVFHVQFVSYELPFENRFVYNSPQRSLYQLYVSTVLGGGVNRARELHYSKWLVEAARNAQCATAQSVLHENFIVNVGNVDVGAESPSRCRTRVP